MSTDFHLPELGENIDSATVVEVLVAVGDGVVVDQPLMSLETDKAEFELPCTLPGTVAEILVKAGDEVSVGQVVMRIVELGESAGQTRAQPSENAEEARASVAAPEAEAPRAAGIDARAERTKPAPTADGADAVTGDVPVVAVADRAVAAAPSVRKLARELGVTLQDVAAACASDHVSSDNVRAFAAGKVGSPAAATGGFTVPPGSPLTSLLAASELPDFSAWGEIEVEAMSKIRRKTAENMSRAWVEIPQVTQYDDADITELDVSRRKHGPRVQDAGGRFTWTAILLQVVARTLVEFPKFNASVDMTGHRIIYKKYVHVGIAVDTERGLLVPVVRDADKKGILQLATDLHAVADHAKNRNIKPDMMQGATFTITNLGGIGGIAFSPIVNPPQVAILGVSRSELRPRWIDGRWQPRLVMPLALSYDHRVIDGADAARFLRSVCEALEKPLLEELDGE